MQFLEIVIIASILATFVSAAPLPQDDADLSETYSGIPSGVTPSGFPDIRPSGFSLSGAIPSGAMTSGYFRDHHGHHGDRLSGVTPSGTGGFQGAGFTGSVFPSGVFPSGVFPNCSSGPEPTGGHYGHHEHHEHHGQYPSGVITSGSLDAAAAQRTGIFSGIFPGHGGQGGVRFSSTTDSATPEFTGGVFPGHGGQGGVRFSSTVSVSATPTPSVYV